MNPNSRETILAYLRDQNRPFSVNDIGSNLQTKIEKNSVGKCLEELVQSDIVKEKVYGKQKVYVYNQNKFPPKSDENTSEMDQRIKQLTETLKQSEDYCRQKEAQLKFYNSALSTDQLKEEIQNLTSEIESKSAKLQALRKNCQQVSYEEKDKIMKERTKALQEWRKRKRMSMDVIGAVLEGYPSTKKRLMEELEIETDEEHKVTIPEK